MYLPEWPAEIESGAVEITGQGLKLSLAGVSRQSDGVQVVVQIEQGVVFPVDLVTFVNDALPKAPEFQETFFQGALESLERNGVFKGQYRGNHHGIFRGVHA